MALGYDGCIPLPNCSGDHDSVHEMIYGGVSILMTVHSIDKTPFADKNGKKTSNFNQVHGWEWTVGPRNQAKSVSNVRIARETDIYPLNVLCWGNRSFRKFKQMVHFGDATDEPEENCATLDVFLTMLDFEAFLVRTANILENERSSCSFTHRTSPTFSIQYAPNEWHFMYVLNCTRRISFLECAFHNQYVHIKIKLQHELKRWMYCRAVIIRLGLLW